MSDRPYRTESDVPTSRIIERLEELACSIGKKAGTGDWSEFYMRIPADPYHDADLIMGEAAKRLRQIESLQRTNEELKHRIAVQDVFESSWRKQLAIAEAAAVTPEMRERIIKMAEIDDEAWVDCEHDVRLIIRRVCTQQTSESTWREETTCETVIVNSQKLKNALTKQGVVELVGYEIVNPSTSSSPVQSTDT